MNSVTRLPEAFVAPGPTAAPSVDVVVPVHNEQGVLPATIRRLHDYLSAALPLVRWRIVIADNASTDETLRIAMALAEDLPDVQLLALTQKGRGRALRAAWERSEADVVCYMDADLSTDLRALPPLLAPLLSGHSDVAIGTRLASGSRVVRGRKREFISRGYNRLLHTVLGAAFLGRPVRLQGRSRRRRPPAAAGRARRGLVLRHRAAGRGAAGGDAHP